MKNKNEKIKYASLFCNVCQWKTSHAEIDTVEGSKMACEYCGTIFGEEGEQKYNYRKRQQYEKEQKIVQCAEQDWERSLGIR